MSLAVVRSLAAPRGLHSPQDAEDFEQQLVDQYLLAALGSGLGDRTVAADRAVLFEFICFLGRPVWTAQPADADRFLVVQRTQLGRARLTEVPPLFRRLPKLVHWDHEQGGSLTRWQHHASTHPSCGSGRCGCGGPSSHADRSRTSPASLASIRRSCGAGSAATRPTTASAPT